MICFNCGIRQASDTCTNCGYSETIDLVGLAEYHTCCPGDNGSHSDFCPEMFAGTKLYLNDQYFSGHVAGYAEGYEHGFEDGSQPKPEPISLGWMDIPEVRKMVWGSHGSFYLRDGGFVPVSPEEVTSTGTGTDPNGPGSQSVAWSPQGDLGWTGAPYHKGKEQKEEREYDYADPWNHPSDGNPK